MGLSLTNPALREFLVYLDALLGICKGSCWVHKLRVGRRPIGEDSNVFRIAPDSLIELLEG